MGTPLWASMNRSITRNLPKCQRKSTEQYGSTVCHCSFHEGKFNEIMLSIGRFPWGGRNREIEVREIRTLELEQGDAPECWCIDRPHTLTVCHGMLWVTIEDEPDDRWLRAGESVELSP